jgi:hypothetical protein
VMPHLGGVLNPMPVRTFAAGQQEVDRRRVDRATGILVTKRLAEPATLRVRLQLELIDELSGSGWQAINFSVCRSFRAAHSLAPSLDHHISDVNTTPAPPPIDAPHRGGGLRKSGRREIDAAPPNDLQLSGVEFGDVLFELREGWLGIVEGAHHQHHQLIAWRLG